MLVIIPLSLALMSAGLIHLDYLYTSTAFILASILLVIHITVLKSKYIYVFGLSYLVHLLPFLIVNGLLTGLPVVKYNSGFITGLRVISIPVEDFLFALSLFLSNVTVYEFARKSK
jgi:lycopene cyclase domain-containing protein